MFESHFQSFDDTTDRAKSATRLALLRQELETLGVDACLVPRADCHQNEYVPPSEERLAWLTGFTGSAGLAAVLRTEAAIFVDGRYTLAVRDQVDISLFAPVPIADVAPEAWLQAHLAAGARLAYDPWLHTSAQVARLERATTAVGAKLVALDRNPIDAVWQDRPAPPLGRITAYPPRLAGLTAAKKLAAVAKTLEGRDALVVSDPHAVAWAFNIRGQDVSHTPLPLAFALVPAQGKPSLYVDGRKLDDRLRVHLSALAEIAETAQLEEDLRRLGAAGKKVLFDSATAPAKLSQILEAAGGKPETGADPIAMMKARKSAAELKGTRLAHLRDGAAIVNFLHWFDENAGAGRLTEIDAAQALESFRRATKKLKDVSFPSISAAGPNAAIPHYRVTTVSNRPIAKGIFLIDSGGQYEDGTTDITRTLAVGKPSALMRDRFTRVLKGHIAISRAVFPKGTSGAQIDALARAALWQAGLDFDHGTGHGVGAYLSVHEGPQRISRLGTVPLEPGMILSNEPGYYNAGHWGIRIENLVVVEPREIPGGEREMLGFETITFAPIDLALVDARLLDATERAWLDAYHAAVRKNLADLVTPPVRKWLVQATRKLKSAV